MPLRKHFVSGCHRVRLQARRWLHLTAIGSAFWNLIIDWMKRDRIRVSPTKGRLLGLREGDQVLVIDDIYFVQNRRIDEESNRVRMRLNGDDVTAGLTVPFGRDGRGEEGVLEIETKSLVVHDDDVVVLK